MHVQVRFALDSAAAPPGPNMTRLLLRLPARSMALFARGYTGAFLYGLVAYLTGWIAFFVWWWPRSTAFSLPVLVAAATAWIPFLWLYVICIGWIVASQQRQLELQREAIERLENEFGDVIGEAVTMAVNQIEAIGKGEPGADLDPFFKRR